LEVVLQLVAPESVTVVPRESLKRTTDHRHVMHNHQPTRSCFKSR